MRWRSAALPAIAVLGVVASSVVLHARDRWLPLAPVVDPVEYVTNGRILSRVSLGFDAVMADVYWIRAIQHYGRERRSPRYEGRYAQLYPLVDITTTLDPHFTLAYQFGALFLAEPLPNGPGRVDLAMALLEKGLTVDPDRWQYAQYLGFIHYWHRRDRLAAGHEFARAARMPGAPNWLQPLAASSLIEGGDTREAREMLLSMAASPDRWVRELAERKLRELGPS